MSDEIYQFIEARIDESERACQGMRFPGIDFMQVFFDNMRCTLEFHKNWPILVEQHERSNPALDADPVLDFNKITYTMTRKFAFVQGQEYIKVFGGEAPTTPMLRVWASSWASHPDFKPEWMLTPEEWQKHLGLPPELRREDVVTANEVRKRWGLPPREGNTASNDQ